jgi:exonuclease III
MDMLNYGYKFLSWNVRGLDNTAKQEDVKQIISFLKPDLLCLQETKLVSVDSTTIRNCLRSQYENNYAFLPADGTRGGIILAANCSSMSLSNPVHINHTLSAPSLRHQEKLYLDCHCCVWASGRPGKICLSMSLEVSNNLRARTG